MSMFAWCRSKPIGSIQYLTAQTMHARREDTTSPARIRPGAEAGASLAWSLDDGPRPDYGAAFKALKKGRGAGERKGAQLGLHMLVGVSPEWVREAGDLHDPANPRNRQLLDAARAWADTWSGGGCYAARLDLDETGGAVVDLFIAPLAEQKHKSGKSKLVVSVNKALEALSVERTGRKGRHYAALNTDWAEYARTALDPRLERGRSKAATGAEHVAPDAYRTMMTEAQAARDAAREREAAAARREAEAEAERRRLGETMDAFSALSDEIEQGTIRLADDGKITARNPARLRSGGRVVARIARALLAVMGEVSALRKDLQSALDEGRIRPERRAAAEAAASRPARPSRVILAALDQIRERNEVSAEPQEPDPFPSP